jgi:hypothetical protein
VTIRPALVAVGMFAMTGVAEAADGGLREQQPQARPRSAPGALLGPLPAGKRGSDVDGERQYRLTARPDGGAFYDSPEFSATVAADGTVTFHDHRLRYSPPDAAATFDLSDEFAREFGHGTQYRYQKANFLAATFRERTEMAAHAHSVRVQASLDDIPSRLDALWSNTRYRRRERRRIIFLLCRPGKAIRRRRSSRAGFESAFHLPLRALTARPSWTLCRMSVPTFRGSPRTPLHSRCGRRDSATSRGGHGIFPCRPENLRVGLGSRSALPLPFVRHAEC